MRRPALYFALPQDIQVLVDGRIIYSEVTMKSIIVILSVVCFQWEWSYGTPISVSSYAYQDSAGNRYGGTFHSPDVQLNQFYGPKEIPFQIPFAQNFYQEQDFFPEYFRNLEYLIQEAFQSNLANQRLALEAAQKAYDLTSNQAGYIPYFPFRSSDIGFDMFNSPNSAFAGAAVGPGFTQQIAAINPANPANPNINVVERYAEPPNGGKFVSMSSKAYSISSNINGQEYSDRGAETVVNKDGKITAYSVKN